MIRNALRIGLKQPFGDGSPEKLLIEELKQFLGWSLFCGEDNAILPGGKVDLYEPPRVSRRLFGLSQAATLEA